MIRKGTREQNDISRIIGNLPIRLQRKIAEEVLATGSNGTDQLLTQNHASARQEHRQTNVNGAASPVLESSGCVSGVPSPDESVVPGILRVNLQTTESVGGVGVAGGSPAHVKREIRRNGLRTQTPRENGVVIRGAFTRDLSPISPARFATKSMEYPPWFDTLDLGVAKELKHLQDTLAALMQHNSLLEKWPLFCETRAKLQQIFTHLLFHNLKFCCEQKVYTFFWKALCYNVRKELEAQCSLQATECIRALLDDALLFYTSLLRRLSEKYLAPVVDAPLPGEQRPRTGLKIEFIGKVVAQKMLICLGDLSRYKARLLQTGDYAEAARYYQHAQHLIPTNGIPYNQLAIIALLERKKFDAVYFHMRSLMSSNAIYTARESLLVLFDELRKKYEETELKTSPQHQLYHNNHYYLNNHHAANESTSKSMRREVWIYPDGVRCMHRSNENSTKLMASEEHRLSELSPEELQRRFTLLYLYVIGKLYAGIGMETIQEHQRKLLVQLNVLLKRHFPLVLTRSRLLKIVALNIFILDHNMHKESRREIRYHAFNFCNEVFGLLLRKCNELFEKHAVAVEPQGDGVENDDNCLYDLNTLLQFIKVYCDWLALNVHIWEPIRSEEHIFIYCWTELQRLFSLTQSTTEAGECGHAEESTVLFEDAFLIAFPPLKAVEKSLPNIGGDDGDVVAIASEVEQFRVRVAAINNFQQCYDKHRQLLEISMHSSYVVEELNEVISTALNRLDIDGGDEQECFENEENDAGDDRSHWENIVANGERHQAPVVVKISETTMNSAENAQMSQFLKLKNELAAKTNGQRMYNDKLQEILKYVDSKVYIEVRPRYLLPDTNCFVDCLEDFELLAKELKRYTLIVPLTVVKELDGLSKGVKLETLQKHRIHHFDDVSSRAKKSLEFIKTSRRVKCATTKGSIINASMFGLVEEEYVSNDDKILATAVALSRTMSTERSQGGKCLIQTELVLITTDRNLRVKALSRNLAVSGLTEFLQWATDCNN